MADSLFQVTGVASGISWDEIIEKTLTAARTPAVIWENKIDTLEYKRSLYQDLSSQFYKLRSTLTTLKLESTYRNKTAEFSTSTAGLDANSVLKATVSPDAEISAWKIKVDQLAESQRHISKRVDDVGAALGIESSIRLQVGQQFATLEIEATDSLRTINQKINKLKDQSGGAMAVTSMILDNRLVIEGAVTGLDNSGLLEYDTVTMGPTNQIYLPRSENGYYPEQLYSLTVEDDSVNRYLEGVDYVYDSSRGLITWLDSTGSQTAKRPAEGAAINLIYTHNQKMICGDDTMPILPNGGDYVSTDPAAYEVYDKNVTKKYIYGTDYTIDFSNMSQPKIMWIVGGDSPSANEEYIVRMGGQSPEELSGKRAAGTTDVVPQSAQKTPLPYWDGNYPPVDTEEQQAYDAWARKNYALYDSDGNQYEYGTDYTIVMNSGTVEIEWAANRGPAENASYKIVTRPNSTYTSNYNKMYLDFGGVTSENLSAMRATSGNDVLTAKNSPLPYYTGTYPPSNSSEQTAYDTWCKENYALYDSGGNQYTYGTDYSIVMNSGKVEIQWASGQGPAVGDSYKVVTHPNAQPISDSALAKLGFITVAANGTDWDWTEGSVREAQDAILTVNGVPITRTENEIDDIIANVTLELTGTGEVRMDIVQDAEKAIEAMEAFIEAYNNVLSWINEYMNEKYDANSIEEDDDDYLQNLLSASKGTTVFGPLHGDSLLWTIKNQMRAMMSNPVGLSSNTISTKGFLHTNTAIGAVGSFYIGMGGKMARIDIEATDTLQDIQAKLDEAKDINSGALSKGADMNFIVEIDDNGRLSIKAKSNTKTSTTDTQSITRGSDGSDDYDLLPYIVDTRSPIDGELKIQMGYDASGNEIYYQEGVDYRIVTEPNKDGTSYSSKIVWLEGGTKPRNGQSVPVVYTYNPSAITFSEIDGSSKGADTTLTSMLGLHSDTSSAQLSTLGITTEETDYGKSGLLVFDSDKFFEAIKNDPDMVAKTMVQFMRDMDAYIGNLVDSSNQVVGGTIMTKGRIAGALSSIDSEISQLNKQVTNLDRILEQRQKDMYKRYSDMEVAIQTMNAQMSSLTQYFNNNSNSSS